MVTVNGEARSIAGLTLQDYLKTTSYDLTRHSRWRKTERSFRKPGTAVPYCRMRIASKW